MAPPISILWFRRDLRLADNPALVAAAAAGDVLPLFVHDARLAGPSGANRVAFLHASLDALGDGIAALGGRLIERTGDPVAVVADLAAEVGASTVFVARDFGPYGHARDEGVQAALDAQGTTFERVGSPYAVDPGSVLTKSGTTYRVFTPFSRAWREHGWDAPVAVPGSISWAEAPSEDRPPTPTPTLDGDLPPAGEEAAQRCLDRFLADHVDDYATGRDRPDLDATSRLSPHLKFGTIHPRQVLDELGDDDGARTFASEICWREFYADVLWRWPNTVRDNFASKMDGLRWDEGAVADDRFEAWCEGRTGFPIVDAGMRQLRTEGWMHNRVRMIVASFLVKDLHIDWRRGADWFMENLLDGDLASNVHGWQWTAGTGTDASPFFRVFNPTSQGERFDPDGAYVRRYLGDLHDRPAPIVDHRVERLEALDRYEHR